MSGLLDTRRNLLTVILVASIAVLGLALVGQGLMMGRVNVDRIPVAGQTGIDDSQADVPETGLENFDAYTAITERPVFFSDRRLPVVEVMDPEEEPPEPLELVDDSDPIEDLKAVVAGIIITPEMRMAMVRDEVANKTMVLREGMSLEGEQAAWRLNSITPRMVNFVSVDGRESDLELKVHTSGLTAGSPGTVRTPARTSRREAAETPADIEEALVEEGAEEAAPAADDARARAEEVRRRVAERRAELRAEAERRAQMQQQRQDN